ncbi:MAG: tRNA pseudouridine(55) synthase TruB, partial [Bacilli bacterium]|nr:tRNA pseudouridine(55) synthase TruB [Bacilli bacterium]
MNNKYKGVIFDLDGTLLYTLQDITDALNYAIRKNGLKEITTDEARFYVGSGAKVLVERVIDNNLYIKNGKVKKTDELFLSLYNNYMDKYKDICTVTTKPYNGIIRTLNTLKRLGYKLAVVSNKPKRDTDSVIKRYFGEDLFDVVFGALEGIPLKPNPEAIYEVIKLLELNKEEVIYVGDSDIDAKTAINSGIYGLMVCYGYRTKEELKKAGALHFVNAPMEIAKFLSPSYNGILLINKPYKMTSQDCITFVKKKLNITKIGHAGTLDPLATGLLIVLAGDATKLSNYLLEEEKEYIAKVLIGKSTPTWDLESDFDDYKEVKPEEINEETIDKVLSSFLGEVSLPVPSHSAVKVDGKKLYEKARLGKETDVITRINVIKEIKRVSDINYSDNGCEFSIKVKVSKGTYIRSLCREIGIRLNYPSVMIGLIRTK